MRAQVRGPPAARRFGSGQRGRLGHWATWTFDPNNTPSARAFGASVYRTTSDSQLDLHLDTWNPTCSCHTRKGRRPSGGADNSSTSLGCDFLEQSISYMDGECTGALYYR